MELKNDDQEGRRRMEGKKEKAERRKGYWKAWRTSAHDRGGDDELGEEGEVNEKDHVEEERRDSREMQMLRTRALEVKLRTKRWEMEKGACWRGTKDTVGGLEAKKMSTNLEADEEKEGAARDQQLSSPELVLQAEKQPAARDKQICAPGPVDKEMDKVQNNSEVEQGELVIESENNEKTR